MKNIDMKVEDNILTIKVDLSKRHGLSASGKNEIVATTSGNTIIEDTEVKIGLNVFTKPSS